MKALVTGHAGFVGFHVALRLLRRGDIVIGFDNVNSYYDPVLKEARLNELSKAAREIGAKYTSIRADLADEAAVEACFGEHRFDRVVHLAAQAGVRYSLENPQAYVHSNLVGFTNVLEACRNHSVPHLTYASSSSVYGANTKLPFSEHHGVDHPVQFYAATKRANELMAHSYSHLFGLPTTGLRFFTVYGPWGRPDMAFFRFTQQILAGEPIQLFNHGKHTRDFTYVDDVAEGTIHASDAIATPNDDWLALAPDVATSNAPFRILNMGNGTPVTLDACVDEIENAIGIDAQREYIDMQLGDVADTHANVDELERWVHYRPSTTLREGVSEFVRWYRQYYAA